MQLTLVSYNIHSGIGVDGRFDLDRTGKVLAEISPDLVALQEVGDYRGRTPHSQHPDQIAETLGLQMVFAPNVEINGRRYGNAVLSRLPITGWRNYDLSIRGREPRGALRCDVDLGGGHTLHVFCLHLGLSIGERRAQESLLLSADILRDAVRHNPVIVCGDFNYFWGGTFPGLVRNAIREAAHLLSTRYRSYPSRFPFLRLDRIYLDDGVKPLSIHAHRSFHSSTASDHLPVVLRFEAPVQTLHA